MKNAYKQYTVCTQTPPHSAYLTLSVSISHTRTHSDTYIKAHKIVHITVFFLHIAINIKVIFISFFRSTLIEMTNKHFHNIYNFLTLFTEPYRKVMWILIYIENYTFYFYIKQCINTFSHRFIAYK